MYHPLARATCTCGFCKKEFTLPTFVYNRKIRESKSGLLFHRKECYFLWLKTDEAGGGMQRADAFQ